MDAPWTHRNLCTQGYDLTPDQTRALRFGLRFPTAACWLLVVAALATGNALLMTALIPVGVVAGWGRSHPFDVVWNRVVREPQIPPTPRRRRHAFKLGAACVAGMAALLWLDRPDVAWLVGAPLLVVCGVVTTTNWCLPSRLLCAWEARRG